VGSRLAFDRFGRLVAIEVDGHVWVVIGNTCKAGGPGFGWMGQTGRPPTARERAEARPPYQDPRAARRQWGRPATVEDDELDEQAAIAAAYAEQRRQPADLLAA
jgi:Ser/Thr protein kinase RdoA (MazF antagonist)